MEEENLFGTGGGWRDGRGWPGMETYLPQDNPLRLRSPLAFQTALPSPFDRSHFPAEIQGAFKIKKLVTHWLWGKWLLLQEGSRGLGTQQGVGRRLLTPSYPSPGPFTAHMEAGVWGPPARPAPHGNYHSLAGHRPDHPTDGNLGPRLS